MLPSSVSGANEKIVLGMIGAGSRGRQTIISACRVNENIEIKTVCDVNDQKAAIALKQIESELGYKPSHARNMKEVFDDKDIDAVWI